MFRDPPGLFAKKRGKNWEKKNRLARSPVWFFVLFLFLYSVYSWTVSCRRRSCRIWDGKRNTCTRVVGDQVVGDQHQHLLFDFEEEVLAHFTRANKKLNKYSLRVVSFPVSRVIRVHFISNVLPPVKSPLHSALASQGTNAAPSYHRGRAGVPTTVNLNTVRPTTTRNNLGTRGKKK